jgi:uncharacterized protein YcfJ
MEVTMRIIAVAVASVATLSGPAVLGAYDRYGNWYDPRNPPIETARVVETHPVYEAATAYTECWNTHGGHYEELKGTRHANAVAGTAAGAVVGGVIGHQFNRGAGTAAGAILGGIIGNQIARERVDTQPDLDRSRCRTAYEGRELVGYDVHYRYDGIEYVARLSHDPGDRVVLGEDVRYDGRPFA